MIQAAVITREDAVAQLASCIADRNAFLITAAPNLTLELAQRIAAVGPWTGYLDTGVDHILQTNDIRALATTWAITTAVNGAAIAVFTVPKTVPAKKLSKAVGQNVPADGSQDILIVNQDARFYWPLLFVDAVERVDPAMASSIRASDVRNLS